MATRSSITVKLGNTNFHGIYCHWDGYPSTQLPILTQHYNTLEKVKELVALGSLSVLDRELAPAPGVRHDYDHRAKGVTLAMTRDDGREMWIVKARSWANVVKRIDCAYSYLFEDGQWFVSSEVEDFDHLPALAFYRDGKWHDEPKW